MAEAEAETEALTEAEATVSESGTEDTEAVAAGETGEKAEPGQTADAGEKAGTGKKGFRPGHRTWVTGLTVIMAVVYGTFSLVMDYTYRVAIYDLTIFDQAIRSYAHFQPGISIAKGLHNFGNPNFSVLGDHFSPIDALLAPLYWIYNDPADLLIAQAVLLALAVPPIWAFTRRAFGGGRKGTIAAYCAAGAYALSWPIAAAAGFNYHEVAFAPVLTAVALERLQKGRLKTALLALFGLLLVKEDMGLMVAGLGLGLIVTRPLGIPRQRLTGLLIAVAALAATGVALYVVIPHMGGRSNYYWGYDDLGPNATAAAKHLLLHPLSSARILITPSVKWHTELELFVPFLFLSLLSPITIAVLPLLLERMLSMKFPGWWSSHYQYNAYLVVPLLLGAVDGALRLDRWAGILLRRTARVRKAVRGRIALGAVAGFAVVAVALVPHFQLGQMFQSSFYHRDSTAAAEAAAVAHVPSGVVVEAAGNVGPHLDARDTVEVWDGDGDTPKFPPWVIASDSQVQFTWSGIPAQQQRIAQYKARGYVTVFTDDGFIVMHAPHASLGTGGHL